MVLHYTMKTTKKEWRAKVKESSKYIEIHYILTVKIWKDFVGEKIEENPKKSQNNIIGKEAMDYITCKRKAIYGLRQSFGERLYIALHNYLIVELICNWPFQSINGLQEILNLNNGGNTGRMLILPLYYR